MKVGLVSNSNFTASHAHRPVYFLAIAGSFVTGGLSVRTAGTSTPMRPEQLNLHYSSAHSYPVPATSSHVSCPRVGGGTGAADCHVRNFALLSLARRHGCCAAQQKWWPKVGFGSRLCKNADVCGWAGKAG